jgi:hypothetical protein
MSYAEEDKVSVAIPLTTALQAQGVSVWIDVEQLVIGDRLRPSIDAAIATCAFAAVVFSPYFFEKKWPQYELDGIVSRSIAGGQVMFPIWHMITREDVLARTPSLAYKISRHTSEFTIKEIASDIARIVHASRQRNITSPT